MAGFRYWFWKYAGIFALCFVLALVGLLSGWPKPKDVTGWQMILLGALGVAVYFSVAIAGDQSLRQRPVRRLVCGLLFACIGGAALYLIFAASQDWMIHFR